MNKKGRKFYVIGRHVKDCYAIRNYRNKTWTSPWGAVQEKVYFGSTRTPMARGHRIWIVVGCNCTGCGAQLAVRLEDILSGAPSV